MSTPTQTAVAYGPADVLEVAARTIEEVGLWQGGMTEEDGPRHCALTAIKETERELGCFDSGAWEALCRTLGYEGDHGRVYRWNDTAESAGVVVGALRATAAGLGR